MGAPERWRDCGWRRDVLFFFGSCCKHRMSVPFPASAQAITSSPLVHGSWVWPCIEAPLMVIGERADEIDSHWVAALIRYTAVRNKCLSDVFGQIFRRYCLRHRHNIMKPIPQGFFKTYVRRMLWHIFSQGSIQYNLYFIDIIWKPKPYAQLMKNEWLFKPGQIMEEGLYNSRRRHCSTKTRCLPCSPLFFASSSPSHPRPFEKPHHATEKYLPRTCACQEWARPTWVTCTRHISWGWDAADATEARWLVLKTGWSCLQNREEKGRVLKGVHISWQTRDLDCVVG